MLDDIALSKSEANLSKGRGSFMRTEIEAAVRRMRVLINDLEKATKHLEEIVSKPGGDNSVHGIPLSVLHTMNIARKFDSLPMENSRRMSRLTDTNTNIGVTPPDDVQKRPKSSWRCCCE